MSHSAPEALKLPDQLLVRYFRAGEIDHVKDVRLTTEAVIVRIEPGDGTYHYQHWRDLGGGLGYVPSDPDASS